MAKTYTIKKGDTLWGIAETYLGKGSEYPKIKTLNGLKSDNLKVGQVLKLPEPSEPDSEPIKTQFRKALNDVENLPSVKKLMEMIGE